MLPQLIEDDGFFEIFEVISGVRKGEWYYQRKDECRAYSLMIEVERMINSLLYFIIKIIIKELIL